MKNKLIGYKIRGDYYLEDVITFSNRTKHDDKEKVNVYTDENPPEVMMYVTPDEIENIYSNDESSVEIYKLKVNQLESEIKSIKDMLSEQNIEIDKFNYNSLLDSIARNSHKIIDIESKQRVNKYSQKLTDKEIKFTEARIRTSYTDLFDKLLENISAHNKKQALFNAAITVIVLVILIFQ